MKKIITLLLCCGVLVGMVGCGGNTAPPSMESSPTTVTETTVTEVATERIPPTTAVEQTEKETGSIKSQKQTIEPTSTTPTTTEEKVDLQVEEIVTGITSQHTEIEITTSKSTKEIAPESETIKAEFDINYWISFAKEYAVSVGLTLESEAVSCWDNPIGAGAHCVYLERDIKSRLNRYAKDEDLTDVWIWAEPAGDDCYDIYIGYA